MDRHRVAKTRETREPTQAHCRGADRRYGRESGIGLLESESVELDEYLTELERLERIHRGERNLPILRGNTFRKRETRAIRQLG
ncbi:hypothetical protein P7H16_15250 [Paenibacillus larvae]|nr:hypothetical protein [Paenibacillus larvae]MDT2248012.1 hypothetical protein [Paenibacillus larvae]